MADEPDLARLRALEERIAAAKRARATPPRRGGDHHSQAQVAWRMVIELVAGLGIGASIGYGLDVLFGTGPLLMVIFLFLGLAAGVKTMVATAQEVKAPPASDPNEAPAAGQGAPAASAAGGEPSAQATDDGHRARDTDREP